MAERSRRQAAVAARNAFVRSETSDADDMHSAESSLLASDSVGTDPVSHPTDSQHEHQQEDDNDNDSSSEYHDTSVRESTDDPSTTMSDAPAIARSLHPSLYEMLSHPDVATDTIVSDWLQLYLNDGDDAIQALADLISLILHISGCKPDHCVVSRDHIQSGDPTQSLKSLLAKYGSDDKQTESDATAYLFAPGKDKVLKRTKHTVMEFWTLFFDKVRHSVLFDGILFKHLTVWVATMTSSAIRPVRHSASMIAFLIMSSLCTIARDLQDDLQKLNRDMEQQQQQHRREDTHTLSSQATYTATKVTTVKAYLSDLFSSVFVHRYRDVSPLIRAEAMRTLGDCIASYTETYLDDNYLKYLGWALSDKDADVRLQALRSLYSLYSHAAFLPHLHAFTLRFKSRLVEMSRDVQHTVRIAAIQLATLLSEHALLDPSSDAAPLMRLVLDANADIRRTLGPFLYALIEPSSSSSAHKKTAARKKKTVPTTEHVLALARFIATQCESSLEEQGEEGEENASGGALKMAHRVICWVDALWDSHPAIQAWSLMLDLLLQDENTRAVSAGNNKRRSADALSVSDERCLIAMLRGALTKTSGIDDVLLHAQQQQQPMAAAATTNMQRQQKAVQQYTAQLLPALPTLLARSRADREMAHGVLSLCLYLDGHVVRQEDSLLRALMQALRDIYLERSEDALLRVILDVHVALQQSVPEDVQRSLAELHGELNARLRTAVADEQLQATEEEEEEMETRRQQMTSLLRRYSSLLVVFDDNECESPIDALFAAILTTDMRRPRARTTASSRRHRQQQEEEAEETLLQGVRFDSDILLLSLKAAYRHLLWQLNVSESVSERTRQVRENLVAYARHAMTSDVMGELPLVQLEAFRIMADLVCLSTEHPDRHFREAVSDDAVIHRTVLDYFNRITCEYLDVCDSLGEGEVMSELAHANVRHLFAAMTKLALAEWRAEARHAATDSVSQRLLSHLLSYYGWTQSKEIDQMLKLVVTELKASLSPQTWLCTLTLDALRIAFEQRVLAALNAQQHHRRDVLRARFLELPKLLGFDTRWLTGAPHVIRPVLDALTLFHQQALAQILDALSSGSGHEEVASTVYCVLFRALCEFIPKQHAGTCRRILSHVDQQLSRADYRIFAEELHGSNDYLEYRSLLQRHQGASAGTVEKSVEARQETRQRQETVASERLSSELSFVAESSLPLSSEMDEPQIIRPRLME